MKLAERIADQIVADHGSDPWRVADGLGLSVFRQRLPKPHRELYFARAGGTSGVIIAADATDREARGLVAHGIAHHLLHAGDRLTTTSRALWSGRHEREAEDFAACLLVPASRIRREHATSQPVSMAELAEEMNVDEALLRRRVRLLRGGEPAALTPY